ncbi:MAG TPA: hypothetical protein VF556_11935 [Pyrinomonadaceae bacterium]|jgi:hypothetical protein
MIAGLPGTGISGLFYLLSAFWMPFAEIFRFLRGRERQSNWRLIFSQFSLALGIFVTLGTTAALLDYFISFSVRFLGVFVSDSETQLVNLGVAPTVITLSVLFAFLFSIEIVGIILSRVKLRGFQLQNKNEIVIDKEFSAKKETIVAK